MTANDSVTAHALDWTQRRQASDLYLLQFNEFEKNTQNLAEASTSERFPIASYFTKIHAKEQKSSASWAGAQNAVLYVPGKCDKE